MAICNYKNKKGANIGVIMWIAFFVVLLLVIVWGMHKAGYLSGQTLTALKNKINPFG